MKLAIASAILIVGIGAALLFRREDAAEDAALAKATSPVAGRSATGSEARQAAAEPKLAGRIEPYQAPATLDRGGDLFARFASNTPAPPQPPANKRHKIIDGDTLRALAQRYLGAEERYLDLFDYNRDVLLAPELLPIGRELRIPPADYVRPDRLPVEWPSTGLTAVAQPVATLPNTGGAPSAASVALPAADSSPRTQTYVVQAHDTLALIARKLYGDIGRQAELMAANRQQLRTPQDLRAGMTLVVPGASNSE